MTKVLITGMSGLIGGLLRNHLDEVGGYELSALNRRPVKGVPCLQADIADLEAIKPAFEGIDVVVHLVSSESSSPVAGTPSGPSRSWSRIRRYPRGDTTTCPAISPRSPMSR